MLCLTHRTDKYGSLAVDDVVNYQNKPYVVIEIGQCRVTDNGNLKADIIVQGVDETDEVPELKSNISKEIRYKNAQHHGLGVFNYIKIIDTSYITKICSINSLRWDGTDLLVRYVAEPLMPFSKNRVKQLIARSKIKQVVFERNDNVISVDFK